MGKGYWSSVVMVDLVGATGNAMAVAAALARSANLAAEVVTVDSHDEPGRSSIEHVVDRGGALLVIGTTTWGSSGIDLLDGVAEEILAQAREPVLVVGPRCTRRPGRTATPVAVVDGSDLAGATMPVVEEWARTFPGAGAKVVEVVPPAGAPIPASDLARHVRRHVDLLTERGIAASGEVLRSGEPASALVAYADDLDDAVLVVTSPRWHGAPPHWFTTTRRLIRWSKRPVLVVPADGDPHRGSPRGATAATSARSA